MDSLKMHIAILGTRGIPNRYGGFEACAEQLAIRLTEMGHKVSVYCSHDHEVNDENWKNVRRILKHNPEALIGSFGQFYYDLVCNLDSRKRNFDIILHLGYTSDSVWFRLWPAKKKHLVNMDGMEWKRDKYGFLTRCFLKWAERMATLRASCLIADNPAIEEYLSAKYQEPIVMIPYGALIPESFSKHFLNDFNLSTYAYDLMVARMEPENNISMAIEAKLLSEDKYPLVIIGNRNKYSSLLQKQYDSTDRIVFAGPVYEQEKLKSLRHYSRFYIHGHSAGGTNPSLLEAMACECNIISHLNAFNHAVLGNHARYFNSREQLSTLLSSKPTDEENSWKKLNIHKIKHVYNWEKVANDYEKLMQHAIKTI